MPIVIACLVGIALFVFLMRKPNLLRPPRKGWLSTPTAMTRDIPDAVRALEQSGGNGSFIVFMFVPPGSTNNDAVNLQYSIEDGMVGLDWMLFGPRNIADQQKLIAFASTLGHRFAEREMNNARYLRVTGNGIAELGIKIIQGFYKIPADTKLDVVVEGIEWPLVSLQKVK